MINRPNGGDAGAAATTQYTREARVQSVKLRLYSGRVLPIIRQAVNRIGLPPRNGKRGRFPAVNLCAQFVYSHTAPPDKKSTASGITRSLARREE
jgi:hypothetical protein